MIRSAGGDPLCFECPLPECEPTDNRCPLNKAAGNGASRRPQSYAKHQGIVPVNFTDNADYHRQYNREYNKRFKRVLVPGIKITRCDLEALEAACKAEGRSLAADIVAVLENMAKQARTAANGKKRKRGI